LPKLYLKQNKAIKLNRFKKENPNNVFDRFISLTLAVERFHKIVLHCNYFVITFFTDVFFQDSHECKYVFFFNIGFIIIVRQAVFILQD